MADSRTNRSLLHRLPALALLLCGALPGPTPAEQQFDQLEQDALAQFSAAAEHIESHALDPVIAERHAAALARFREAAANHRDQGVTAPPADYLRTGSGEDTHTLGFGPLARTTPAPLNLDLAVANSAPAAADLGQTEEVVFTPEITALAASLGFEPVAIYNWVQEHIVYVPSYGSVQGAAHTLQTRHGNAADSASLLIALLRASDIPARYALGRVQIPVATLRDQLGKTLDTEAVLELLGQGGIPHRPVVRVGRIDALELEHVWVEAWIDMSPSRGARHRQGDAWTPLDASFKRLAPGPDRERIPFAGAALAGALIDASRYDPAISWLDGLEETLLAEALADYRALIRAQLPVPAMAGDLLGKRVPEPANRALLAAGLPYRLLERHGAVSVLPDPLRHRFAVRLYNDQGVQTLAFDANLAAIADQQLSLAFVPASPADREALASFIPDAATGLEQLPASIPGYLVEVLAELRLNGDALATAGPFTLGQALRLELVHKNPTLGEKTHRLLTVAGEFHALGWDLQGGLGAALRAAATELAAGPDLDTVAAVFHAGLRAYFAANDIYNQWQAGGARGAVFRAPSFGSLRTVLEVEQLLGIPLAVHAPGVGLDIVQLAVQAAAPGEHSARLFRQMGQLGSSLAHAMLEGLFPGGGPGVSALRSFDVARLAGQRLYSLGPDHDGSVLAALDLDEASRTRINAALASGLRVVISGAPLGIGGWRGIGMAIYDPLLGHGDYRIAGGGIEVRHGTGARYGEWGRLWFLAGFGPALGNTTLWPLLNVSAVQALLAGLAPLAEAPLNLPLTDDLLTLVAGGGIDQAAYPYLPPVLEEQLWGALLNRHITLGQALDPIAPEVQLTVSPGSIVLGESATITAAATDDQALASLSVTVDGVALALDGGQATFTPTRGGSYEIVAVALDEAGNRSEAQSTLTVTDPGDGEAPQLFIHSPADASEVTAPTPFTVSVADDNLLDWTVSYRGSQDKTLTVAATGNAPLDEASVFTFDPTLLPNGLYRVVLEAEDANGQTASVAATYRVAGDLKVGNFSFTEVDLELPVSGIPIRITRTYDTRRKHQALDFGYGWSINYQDVKVEESRAPGRDWSLNEYRSGPNGVVTTFCVEPHGNPLVAVTLPDGRVETFAVRAKPACNDFAPILDVELDLQALDDNLTTLEPADADRVRLQNGHLVFPGAVEPYDPQHYRLTTREGYLYLLDQDFGIVTVTDPNGNTLTYSDEGILHSDGKSVLFQRNAAGRITAITDPLGQALRYAYDADGNLEAFTDPLAQTTRYGYNQQHTLLEIEDPLGRKPLRNIYDDDGRLIAQIDDQGRRTEFAHDIEGRASVVTDRLGRISRLFYNDRGNVVRVIDALGGIMSYSYDDKGNLLSVTDPLGQPTSFTYDDRRNMLSRTDPAGNTVRYTYNTRGQVLTVTDGRGKTFSRTYDSLGNPLSFTDADGNTSVQHIDAKGRVILSRNALGHTAQYAYDNTGNIVEEIDALGDKTRYSYDANGNRLSATRTRTVDGVPVEETTTYSHDARNRVVETIDPLGHSNRTEYDPWGQDAAYIDELGRRTSFEYDAYRRLTRTEFADGTEKARRYDAEGNLLSVSNRRGGVYRIEYDALNRMVGETHTDGAVVRYEYDAADRKIAEIAAGGNRTEFEYDQADYLIKRRDALGQETLYGYDASGNKISETDPNGNTTRYEYDGSDRLTAMVFADGTKIGHAYDGAGRRISTTDQAGLTTRYVYDGLDRMVEVIDALGQSTRHAYDEAGNRIAQTDANGHTTRWTHDAEGRIVSRTLPAGMTESFVYDAAGNRIRHTDFNGVETNYQYDLNDWMIGMADSNGESETIVYDAVGNRSSVVDQHGLTTYEYEDRQRLVRESRPDGSVLAYAYDNNGNRTRLTTTLATAAGSQEQSVVYSYDALNRLQTVTDASGGTTVYDYDPAGKRIRTAYANGTVTNYRYDAVNRLVSLETLDRDGSVIAGFDYELGPTGRRARISEHTGRTVDYVYDDSYRLTEEIIADPVSGDMSNSYQYDAVGNRVYSTQDQVSTAYQYDANDRLLTVGGMQHEYDDNGNLIRTEEDDEVVRYGYDSRNRLIESVTEVGGAVTGTVRYGYDTDGNRVEKDEDGEKTRFVVDRNRDYAQVLAELDGAGQPLADYVYGDDLISQTRAGDSHYFHYDGLGSTRALSDADGLATDSYVYDAFGNLLDSTGPTENVYLFAGEQFDPALEEYYLRARYYDPDEGRFRSMDRFDGMLNQPFTLHKYLYGNADPVNTVDPSGYFGLVDFGAANNIRMELANMEVDTGSSLLDFALTDRSGVEIPSAQIGSFILMGLVSYSAPKILNLMAKKYYAKCGPNKNSFPLGTLVLSKNGSIPIEEVSVEDYVLSFDELSGTTSFKKVTHIIENRENQELITITFLDGAKIETTPNHMLYVLEQGWRPAKALGDDDVLITYTGDSVQITDVYREKEKSNVYNLSVTDNESYYVGESGVLAHNIRCRSQDKKVKKKFVVIGRNMPERVIPFATFFNIDWFSPPFPPPPSVPENIQWIEEMVRQKRIIIDIGPDSITEPSDYYEEERRRSKGRNYRWYFKIPWP